MVSVFSFVILLRREYRDRPEEREHLHALIEELHERFRVPITIVLYKGNNASLMKLSLSSELIQTIIFEEYSSAGHYINSALDQAKSPYCCVIWNDMNIGINLDETLTSWLLEQNCICAVSFNFDQFNELQPSLVQPVFNKVHGFGTIPVFPSTEREDSLFPYDYMGIYDVELFKSVHGYDTVFLEGFWQLSDFGLSSWVRGRPIRICSGFKTRYLEEIPVLETSKSKHMRRFEAKHFNFSLGVELQIQISRKHLKLIPEYMKEDYQKESRVFLQQGKDLIINWNHEL